MSYEIDALVKNMIWFRGRPKIVLVEVVCFFVIFFPFVLYGKLQMYFSGFWIHDLTLHPIIIGIVSVSWIVALTLVDVLKKDMLIKEVTKSFILDRLQWNRRIHVADPN